MLSAKIATIRATTNFSLGIVNSFFSNLNLLAINPRLIPDGLWLHMLGHVLQEHLYLQIHESL